MHSAHTCTRVSRFCCMHQLFVHTSIVRCRVYDMDYTKLHKLYASIFGKACLVSDSLAYDRATVKVPPRDACWLIARYTRPVAMCCGAREDDDDDSGNPGPDINRKCFGSRDYSDYTRRIAEHKLSTSWQTWCYLMLWEKAGRQQVCWWLLGLPVCWGLQLPRMSSLAWLGKVHRSILHLGTALGHFKKQQLTSDMISSAEGIDNRMLEAYLCWWFSSCGHSQLLLALRPGSCDGDCLISRNCCVRTTLDHRECRLFHLCKDVDGSYALSHGHDHYGRFCGLNHLKDRTTYRTYTILKQYLHNTYTCTKVIKAVLFLLFTLSNSECWPMQR